MMQVFDLLAIVDEIVPSDFQSTRKTKAENTKTNRTTGNGDYPTLDVDTYLRHYGVAIRQVKEKPGGTWYHLVECPFNPDHKNGDAAVCQLPSGALKFKCHHDSCDDKDWQAFKAKVGDPNPFYTHRPSDIPRSAPTDTKSPPDDQWGTIDAPGHQHYQAPPPETDEENQDAKEKARRAKRVESLGEKAKARLRQGMAPEQIQAELKAQRDQWGDPIISDAFIEKLLTAEIQAFMPKTVNGEELMQTQFPEPKWVLKGFIGEGIIVVAGRPKMGKSAFALNVGVAVAHGGLALDIPCEAGDVLYCSGITEGSFPEFQDRLKNLLPGEPVSPRIHFMEDLARLDEGGEAQLRLWLTNHPDARLVVLDTLQSFAPRQKRNADAYAEGYDAMSILQRIYRDFNVSILVITHTRKSLHGAVSEWALDEVLGSTSITGASNASLVLRQTPNGFELCTFGRRIKNEEYAVTFDGERGLWTLLGEAERHNVSDQRKAILDLLEQANGETMTPDKVATLLGEKRNNIHQLMWKMRLDGQIATTKKGCYVLPENVDKSDKSNKLDKLDKCDKENLSPPAELFDLSSSDEGDKLISSRENKDSKSDLSNLSHLSQLSDKCESDISENHRVFLKKWQSTYGDQMVRPEKLIPIAQEAGLDLDQFGWSPMTNIERTLRDLTDKTVDGLTLRALGDDAWRIEGQPSNNRTHPVAANPDDAQAYIRHRLQTQADLFRQGKAETLSSIQVGFLRGEVNQRFSTDFVTDDIEGIWDELIQQEEVELI